MKLVLNFLSFIILCTSFYASPIADLNKKFIIFNDTKQGTIFKDDSIIVENKGDKLLEFKLQ